MTNLKLRQNPPCPDLSTLFGTRLRILYEESYYAQYSPNARTNDPYKSLASPNFASKSITR